MTNEDQPSNSQSNNLKIFVVHFKDLEPKVTVAAHYMSTDEHNVTFWKHDRPHSSSMVAMFNHVDVIYAKEGIDND